jgi:hypothetical protein
MSLLTDTGIWAKSLFVAQVSAAGAVLAPALADPTLLLNWKALAAQAGTSAVMATILYLKKSAITIAQEKAKTPEVKSPVYVPIPTATLDKPLNGVRG